MGAVKRFQVLIGLVCLIAGLGRWALAQESEEPPRPQAVLIAVPSFQGTLPDGIPVIAIVVIPAENVLNKNAAWLKWEADWPTTYQVKPNSQESSTD